MGDGGATGLRDLLLVGVDSWKDNDNVYKRNSMTRWGVYGAKKIPPSRGEWSGRMCVVLLVCKLLLTPARG